MTEMLETAINRNVKEDTMAIQDNKISQKLKSQENNHEINPQLYNRLTWM